MLYINNIEKYIFEVLEVDVEIVPLDSGLYKHLPLYITSGYRLEETGIFGQRICLLSPKNRENVFSPDRLAKQLEFVRQKTGLPVVVIFEKVESYNLKRLISKGINFIIPGKQLFLPVLMMNLRKAPEKQAKETNKLTSFAQFLLLYHLQREPLTNKTAYQLTSLFKIPYQTVNKAMRSLEQNGLCNLSSGKEKKMEFAGKGKDLWLKAHGFLQTPIFRTIHTDDNIPEACISNINALAHYTMMNDETRRYYAVARHDEKNLKTVTNREFGENNIEIWRYDPLILSQDGFIDKLSLFLCLQNESDERIQIELETLIENIKWSEG